jgi:hypothetical protein
MRYSSLVFLMLLSGVLFFGLIMLHAQVSSRYQEANLLHKAELVKQLRLTDLCLFTEARYTRHLSQADLNTAFQDHPLSMEHFPSGSFTQPNLPGITR